MKILFLCTGGNSCRSLMAEAFLQKLNKSLEVYSAGLHPDESTDPIAIEVMKEIGIDISTKKPKSYHEFDGMEFDYLITLCDGTKDRIESVDIKAKHHIHLGFEDPKKAYCTEEQLIYLYQDIRDEIKNELDYFYSRILINELKSG
jgi:arsenate reductase (thioredoxin)